MKKIIIALSVSFALLMGCSSIFNSIAEGMGLVFAVSYRSLIISYPIAKYKIENGKFPQSLNDLAKYMLSKTDSSNISGYDIDSVFSKIKIDSSIGNSQNIYFSLKPFNMDTLKVLGASGNILITFIQPDSIIYKCVIDTIKVKGKVEPYTFAKGLKTEGGFKFIQNR
jgi:hypothetical protein